MNIDGIINALECCLVNNNDWAYAISCDGCVFGGCSLDGDNVCRESCSNGIAEEALRVIKMQKVEIEALQSEKTEAVKEFAERLKIEINKLEAKSPSKTYQKAMEDMLTYYFPKIIDDCLEKMVGDTE